MADPARVLVVEDEPNLLNSLAFILEEAGFVVARAASGEEAIARAETSPPDLLLLDIALPGIDGFEVADRLAPLRATIPMRVVMLTGRDVEDDIVRALETCADDYIVKPLRPRVLLARIAALLRKGTGAGALEAPSSGLLEIDCAAFEARLDGRLLDLTPSEFRILCLLDAHKNRVFTRDDIIDAVHGEDYVVGSRAVDFQIQGLRRKLGPAADRIATVRGVGFKLLPR